MRKLREVFTGILVSGIICFVPFAILYLLVPTGRGGSGGAAATSMALLVVPVLIIFSIIILVMQVAAAAFFRKSGKSDAASGVWYFYLLPIASWIVLSIGTHAYQNIFQGTYAGRTFKETMPDLKKVLMVSGKKQKGNNPYGYSILSSSGDCNDDCILFLTDNPANRIGLKGLGRLRSYKIFAHSTGQDCITAKDHSTALEEAQRIPLWEDDRGARIRTASKQFHIEPGATERLEKLGVIDECIVVKMLDAFAHDIRIEAGRDFARFLGPNDVVIVYDTRNGTNKFLTRWEAGSGPYDNSASGKSFSFIHIVNSLTGKTIAKQLRTKKPEFR